MTKTEITQHDRPSCDALSMALVNLESLVVTDDGSHIDRNVACAMLDAGELDSMWYPDDIGITDPLSTDAYAARLVFNDGAWWVPATEEERATTASILSESGETLIDVDLTTLGTIRLTQLRDEAGQAGDHDMIDTIDQILADR